MKSITKFYKTYNKELRRISSLSCSLRCAIEELGDLAHKEWEHTDSPRMEEVLSSFEELMEQFENDVEFIENTSDAMANGFDVLF